MSDEPKITAVEKTKDPKKVEAGKRLAAHVKTSKGEKSCITRTTTTPTTNRTVKRRRMGSSCWSCCRWSCWIGYVFCVHQIHN